MSTWWFTTAQGQCHSLSFVQYHSDSTFSNFSLKKHQAVEATFQMEPPRDVGNETLFKYSGSHDQDGFQAHIWGVGGGELKKSPSSVPRGRWPWNFVYRCSSTCTSKFVQMMTMGYLDHFYDRVKWASWWHEIMAFFVLRKLILQTHMCSHSVGLDVWFLVGPIVYLHTPCVRTAEALARLRGCAGSPQPSLVTCAINTIISCQLAQILHGGWKLIQHIVMYFQACSKSAYPQHSGEQYRTIGPLVMWM